mgnify:FL=1
MDTIIKNVVETVRWSETRTEFAKSFVKAQQSLGIVAKNQTNPHFRSKYADLSNVLDAVLPPLNDNGFSLIQSPAADDQGRVTVTTLVLHTSGEWMESTLAMKPVKADPQGIGSCITYGRRYAALAIAGAAPDDDDGNAASKRPDQRKAPPRAEVGALDQGDRSNREVKDLFNNLKNGIMSCNSVAELEAWKDAWSDDLQGMPADYADSLRGEYARKRDEARSAGR